LDSLALSDLCAASGDSTTEPSSTVYDDTELASTDAGDEGRAAICSFRL